MDKDEKTLLVLELLLQIIRLVMGISEEATDEKIRQKREEIKAAVAKWQ